MIHKRDLDWDVLLIGGASGTGKTSISYRLAQHFGVGITEVDDLHLVLATMTTPAQQPTLHYWATKPDSVEMSAQDILELHVAVCRVLTPALQAVITNHVEERTPLVLEGDYLLPELLTAWRKANPAQADRVQGLFLHEPDEAQLVRNFLQREPDEDEQTGRAHVSWRFGEWLQQECARQQIACLPTRPWTTLFDRALEALARVQ